MQNASATAARLRILIQLPNWLGDVVMTTPLLDMLARVFAAIPETTRPTLHLAVRRPWSVLFDTDPRVAGTIIVDRDGSHGGVGGIWRQAAAFRAGRYGAVLVAPPSLRAGLVAALAGISPRVGHAGDGRGWLLRPSLECGPRGSRHYSYEMLDLGLALLDRMQIAAPLLDLEQRPLATLPGCEAIPAMSLSWQPDQPVWVVAPGTTYGQAKTWPQKRLGEMLELAVGDLGARVVLLGDGQTAGFVAGMRRSSLLRWARDRDPTADIVDLTGQTDLQQVVQVLKAATAFVGNDSGLMHLAGALGVPTVGVFGSSNPEWTHPLGEHTAAVVAAGFACRPCYRKTCNQPQFCLETVSAAAVVQRVQELLARKASLESEER